MRYAAERSGVEVQDLDGSMRTFVAGVGQARAGTGKLAGFLGKIVSPALLKQVKAAKSNEEAFDLMAAAMAKIEDPAKRAAFAQKTFGDASLAPLLNRGPKGLQELRDRYMDLAGSQAGAAGAAGATDDAMKDLQGVDGRHEGALVEGLAPALTDIIVKLRDWLVDTAPTSASWALASVRRFPRRSRSSSTSFTASSTPFVRSSTARRS
jgi:hypothetical protein